MTDTKKNKTIDFYSGSLKEYERLKDSSTLNGAFIDILAEDGSEQGILMLNGVPVGIKEGIQGLVGTQGAQGTQGLVGKQGPQGVQGSPMDNG